MTFGSSQGLKLLEDHIVRCWQLYSRHLLEQDS
jgi:hypothetical protein